ncbi:MAG: hypothetical protein V7724_13965 [Sediminicola sp.]
METIWARIKMPLPWHRDAVRAGSQAEPAKAFRSGTDGVTATAYRCGRNQGCSKAGGPCHTIKKNRRIRIERM